MLKSCVSYREVLNGKRTKLRQDDRASNILYEQHHAGKVWEVPEDMQKVKTNLKWVTCGKQRYKTFKKTTSSSFTEIDR